MKNLSFAAFCKSYDNRMNSRSPERKARDAIRQRSFEAYIKSDRKRSPDLGKRERSPELEDEIMADPEYSYYYATHTLHGKLPEKMHNMMILHAIKDPDDIFVKLYFNRFK